MGKTGLALIHVSDPAAVRNRIAEIKLEAAKLGHKIQGYDIASQILLDAPIDAVVEKMVGKVAA